MHAQSLLIFVFMSLLLVWRVCRCGHCKNLAPEYEKVGATFLQHRDGVVIAKIDADVNKELASRYFVRGFPTLKWIPKAGSFCFPGVNLTF